MKLKTIRTLLWGYCYMGAMSACSALHKEDWRTLYLRKNNG